MNQNKVFCKRLVREMAALDGAPLPGKIGQILLENTSAEAYDDWLESTNQNYQ